MNTIAAIGSKLKRKWKYGIQDVRGLLGLNKQLFQQARGSGIITYHGICKSDHTRFNSIFLLLKTFESHLRFYSKYFNIVSLNDYYHQRFNADRFTICITFDDGFANNYKYVLPLMNRYNIPVCFFVTGIRDAGYDVLWNDFLALTQKYGPGKYQFQNESFFKDRKGQYVSKASGRSLKSLLRESGFDKKLEMMQFFEPLVSFRNEIKEEDYWLQMTGPEIKKLSDSPLATIGCHGYYHNDLSYIPLSDARSEMIQSKKWLENITGREVNAIAFPYGAYSANVLREAKSAGFSHLLATDFLFPGDHADAAMKERLTINPYISVNNQMIATINGKYI